MEANQNRTGIIIGTLLLAAGVLTLFGQFIGPNAGYLWPLVITGIGLAFFIGMLVGGRDFGALAIPGSIITGLGLILLLQNYFGAWETWSYAWALVISLVGIGLVIYGTWSGLPDLQRSGWHVARVGFILFFVFGLMFEFIFAIGGMSFPTDTNGLFWPLMLILVGIVMIVTRSFRLISNSENDRHADLNLFWPVIFIGAGILWAMVRMGMIEASDLTVLISLWPVLLIAGGVNLLIGRRFQWINLILGVLVVLTMFYVVSNNVGIASQAPWAVLGVNINNGKPVNEWVAGSGDIVKDTREVGEFSRVALNSAGELIITQGDSSSLTIEAEDNLLPYIETEVKGDQLVIQTAPGVAFSTTRPIKYHLTVTELEAVSVSGAGSVKADDLEGQSLQLDLIGFGVVNMNQVTYESLKVDISGSGSVTISGSTGTLAVAISGAGNFDGADLEADDVSVQVSGVGRAVVWANENLETEISGVGGVSYYGSPHLTQDTNGLGTVRKLNDK